MISFKDDSIDPGGIRPELLIALQVADAVFASGQYGCIVTSLRDGKHSATSLHYQGAAADLRTRHVEENERQAIRDEIAKRLNRHYDVVLEDTHLHIEYQPRKP